jgi:hypothetical protein
LQPAAPILAMPPSTHQSMADGVLVFIGRRSVPVFREARLEARDRLIKTSKGHQERQVYRDMLGRLEDGKDMEVQPEAGETIRKIKVNVRRSANELGVNVAYGETQDGTLLVWKEAARQRRARRGRPPKATD